MKDKTVTLTAKSLVLTCAILFSQSHALQSGSIDKAFWNNQQVVQSAEFVKQAAAASSAFYIPKGELLELSLNASVAAEGLQETASACLKHGATQQWETSGPLHSRKNSQGSAEVLDFRQGTSKTNPPLSGTCGDGVCGRGESCSTCARDCRQVDGRPCPRIGVMYSGTHWPLAVAMNMTVAMGAPQLTVEDVLRSRVDSVDGASGLELRNVLKDNGLEQQSMLGYWQHRPARGFYCIYHRRRSGDINFNPAHEGRYLNFKDQPDCGGWRDVVARHARELTAAGVDFVAVDMTNLPQYDQTADAIQLRPFEILVQEWSEMRARGERTPDVAAWQRLPRLPNRPDCADPKLFSYSYVLDIYNQPEYEGVILRNEKGRKMYFYPDIQDFDPAYLDTVQGNGGRDDVSAVPMWVGHQARGSWSFFSWCQPGAVFIGDSPCRQAFTEAAVGSGGRQLAISPSYQLSWASSPWQAPGTYDGITFQKQFHTALEVQPDWIFMSSWNEHGAMPVKVTQPAMGLETDPSATDYKAREFRGFTDIYGSGFGRDIEATQERGSLMYDIMASCIRVFRSGADRCTDASELCCQGGIFSDNFVYATGRDGTFGLYSPRYVPALNNGTSSGFASLFNCTGGEAADAAGSLWRRWLLRLGASFLAAQEDASWFLSTSDDCEGRLASPTVTHLGFMARRRGGEMLRALRRCGTTLQLPGRYSLGPACPAGMRADAVLGYVR